MKKYIIFIISILILLFNTINVYSSKVKLNAVVLSGSQNIAPIIKDITPSTQPYLVKHGEGILIKVQVYDYNTGDNIYYAISVDTGTSSIQTGTIISNGIFEFLYMADDTYIGWDNINISINDGKIAGNITKFLRVYNY